MQHGGFKSRSLLDDALTIAIIESGVGLRAFDADRVEGRSGSGRAAPGSGSRAALASCRRAPW